MKLIWHLVWKDLRQHRWPLLVLVVLHLLHLACGAVLLQLGPWAIESAWDYRVGLYAQAAQFIAWGVSGLLVPGIVQADALFGDRAFWKTRPIGWARLLWAKLLTLSFVFVALPLALRLPWWLANGAGFAEVAGNILALVLGAGALLGVAWAVAAVASHSYAYLALMFATAVTLATMYSLLITDLGELESRGLAPTVDAGLAATRLCLAGVVLLVTGIGLIVTQYRRRSQVLGMGWVAGGFAVILLIAKFWMWDLDPVMTGGNSDSEPALSGRIVLAYDGSRYFAGTQAEIDFHLTGVPEGYSVFLQGLHAWDWPDGTRATVDAPGGLVVNTDSGAVLGLPARDIAKIRRDELRRLVQSPWWGEPRALDAPIDAESPFDTGLRVGGRFMLIPQAPLGRIQREKPVYALTAALRLMKPRLSGSRPLQAGAVIDHGGSRLTLLGVTEKEGALTLGILERAPAATLPARLRGLFLVMSSPTPLNFQAWLVNRPAQVAKHLSLGQTGSQISVVPQEWQIADVVIRRATTWSNADLLGVKPAGRTADWLKAIELARLDWDTEASFVRTVRVGTFEVGRRPDTILTGRPEAAKGRRATATGEVNRPGFGTTAFPYLSVLSTLRGGLGFTPEADASQVRLVRTAADGTRSTVRLDVEAYLRGELPEESFPLLQAGDVIEVPRK